MDKFEFKSCMEKWSKWVPQSDIDAARDYAKGVDREMHEVIATYTAARDAVIAAAKRRFDK